MKDVFYFEVEDDDTCYTENHFQKQMKSEGINQMTVFKAVLIKDESAFWCKAHQECGSESSEQCGINNCNSYNPRNGKNGCCKYYSKKLYAPSEKVKLTMKDTIV